ncbi:MAG: hypothetical protein EPO50_06635 [Reyranella sp.]|nr:MAG: hypothetical protein EPO50_06635 [Reyranella sp.]
MDEHLHRAARLHGELPVATGWRGLRGRPDAVAAAGRHRDLLRAAQRSAGRIALSREPRARRHPPGELAAAGQCRRPRLARRPGPRARQPLRRYGLRPLRACRSRRRRFQPEQRLPDRY